MATTTLLTCESQKRSLEEDSPESCKIIKPDLESVSLPIPPLPAIDALPACKFCQSPGASFLFHDTNGNSVHSCDSCKADPKRGRCGLCKRKFRLGDTDPIIWIKYVITAGDKKVNGFTDLKILVDLKLAAYFHTDCVENTEDEHLYCPHCNLLGIDGTVRRNVFYGDCETHCRHCHNLECCECDQTDDSDDVHSDESEESGDKPCEECGLYLCECEGSDSEEATSSSDE
jgi:hypothetical protein